MAGSSRDADTRAGLGIRCRSTRGRWFVGLGLVALAGAGLWVALSHESRAPAGPTWRTATVDRGSIRTVVTATGSVQPVRVVEVGAEISGRVIEVNVDADDPVEAGAVLARLDPEPLQARLEQAQAQLAVAEAAVKVAAATVTETRGTSRRAEQLNRKGLVPTEEAERASAARARAVASLAQAEAQRRLAQAQVRQVEADLAKAVVLAPIGGIVLTRAVEPGSAVAASLQTPVLFTIAEDLRQMHLLLAIDEADVGGVAKGMEATFTVDAFPRQTFQAVVVAVRHAPTQEQNVVTYQAVLEVENPDRLLRPGMTATATIVASEVKDVLRVPNAALRFQPPRPEGPVGSAGAVLTGMPRPGGRRGGPGGRGGRGGPRLWTLVDGKPTPQTVETGATDGRYTEIRGGAVTEGLAVLTGQETPAK
ncbi:MAG: efflux RND transporter periplasmic adaptor subunit [bacterium]